MRQGDGHAVRPARRRRRPRSASRCCRSRRSACRSSSRPWARPRARSRSRCARASRASCRSSSTTRATRSRAGAPLFQIDRAPFEIALAQARAQLEQDKARTEQTQREEARLKPLAAGSRHQPQGIRRRAFGGAARGGGAAAERREGARGRAQPVLHAGQRAGGGRHRPRRAFGRQADHDRCGGQPAHHDQPGQPDLGALQPVRIRSRQDAGRPARRAAARSKCSSSCPTARAIRARAGSTSRPPPIDTKLGTHAVARRVRQREGAAAARPVRARASSPPAQRDNVFLVPQIGGDADGEGVPRVRRRRRRQGRAARRCKMGDWVGSDWMVLSGLAAGDRVIVDNLLKVRPGAPVTPACAGSAAPARRRQGRGRRQARRRRRSSRSPCRNSSSSGRSSPGSSRSSSCSPD